MGRHTIPKPRRKSSRDADVKKQNAKKQSTAHPIMKLQQSAGNQAVQRLLRSSYLQRKLPDSSSGDQIEQQPASSKAQGVQSQIDSLKGGGQPLPPTLRADFESRFGHDFGEVRIHAGAQAAEAAQSINAEAFTVGQDVAFAAGQYSPETGEGQRLLAHELTHVIQQNGASQGTIQRQTGTDYGLALAGSQNKYVAEAVRLWTTNKTMKITAFVDALMKTIETDLLSQGVPEFKWQMQPGLGVSGSFDSEHWIVNIDPDAFSSRGITVTELKDLNLDEVTEVVGTLYHESRHTDQDLLVIRVLLDQKKTVKDIVQETLIPERIVNAVKGKKFKTSPDAAQVAHATRMFAMMYGEHKELLTFLLKNSPVVAGVQSLVGASDASDLKGAAPNVDKLAEWKKNVLEPKLKKLQAGTTGGPVEAQLKQDLGALDQATARLLAAFAAAVKIKNPTKAGLKDLRLRTDEWQKTLVAAYKNLESEKDAFAVEEPVKKAFKAGATAKPKPAPTKK